MEQYPGFCSWGVVWYGMLSTKAPMWPQEITSCMVWVSTIIQQPMWCWLFSILLSFFPFMYLCHCIFGGHCYHM